MRSMADIRLFVFVLLALTAVAAAPSPSNDTEPMVTSKPTNSPIVNVTVSPSKSVATTNLTTDDDDDDGRNTTEAAGLMAPESCSVLLQKTLRGDVSLIPEKSILDSNQSNSDHPSLTNYCELIQDAVKDLNSTCNNANTSAEIEAVNFSKSLSMMVSTLCAANATELKVVAINGSSCMNHVEQVTKNCTAAMNKSYVYPTEMMIKEPSASCALLNESKNCIASGLDQETMCSMEQRQVVIHLMESMWSERCAPTANLMEELSELVNPNTTTTSTPSTSSTSPATPVPVTVKPTKPSSSTKLALDLILFWFSVGILIF